MSQAQRRSRAYVNVRCNEAARSVSAEGECDGHLAEFERPAVPFLHHAAVIFGMSYQMPVVCIVCPWGRKQQVIKH